MLNSDSFKLWVSCWIQLVQPNHNPEAQVAHLAMTLSLLLGSATTAAAAARVHARQRANGEGWRHFSQLYDSAQSKRGSIDDGQ